MERHEGNRKEILLTTQSRGKHVAIDMMQFVKANMNRCELYMYMATPLFYYLYLKQDTG